MTLNKLRIGDIIRVIDEKNAGNLNLPFYGININKEFMPSVANTANVDRKKYKIITKNRFVFSGMQTGRDNCIRIGIYNGDFDILVSPAYTTFEVVSPLVLPKYFFMLFNSREMDRYGAFLSDSSVRANLDWDRFCDIELEIPDKSIQKKYVAIYEGMLSNLHSYEKGLEDLKLTCDAMIEQLRKGMNSKEIEPYIELVDIRNSDKSCRNVKSVSTTKYFNDVGAKVKKDELGNYKLVKPNEISYVQTTGNEKCFAFAINDSNEDLVVTSVNNVFKCKNGLNPYYLGLWFRRKEFDRYARFISWGSARETVSWDDLKQYKIPIPDESIQLQIVNCFNQLTARRNFLATLKEKISCVCPVLIRGSIMEAKGGN